MKRIRAWFAVLMGRAVRLNGATFSIRSCPAHAKAKKSPRWQWGPTVDLADILAPQDTGYVWLRGDDRRPLFIVNPLSAGIVKVVELPTQTSMGRQWGVG